MRKTIYQTEILDVLQAAKRVCITYWGPLLISVIVIFGMNWHFRQFDHASLQYMAGERTEMFHHLAGWLSKYLDFIPGILLPAFIVWIIGYLMKKRTCRIVAIAFLSASILAGIIGNIMRTSAGRPRPHTELTDGFYGPSFSGDYHSFCSCHAITLAAAAITIAIAVPRLKTPMIILTIALAWARIYLHRHYPSDAFLGMALGIVFGIIFGMGARRVLRKEPEILEN